MLRALLYLSPRNYCGRSITPKFSFIHAQYRPNVLGSSLATNARITMDKPIGFQLIYTPSIKLPNGLIWLLVMEDGMLTGNGENNGLF
jgi:hypothetical protein